MKNKNGTYIIGIDHGYGNIKTANCCFPTGVVVSSFEPTFRQDLLIYEGKYYQIGIGHKEYAAEKIMDEDYYVLTLAAIARELAREQIVSANVFIAAGLPLTWVGSQKQAFREYLLQKEEVEFTFRSRDYHIKIIGAEVFPQGFAAIAERIGEFSGNHMLCDIGNGTMNILRIANKKPDPRNMFTEKYGVNQCVLAMREALLREHNAQVDEETMVRNDIETLDDLHADLSETEAELERLRSIRTKLQNQIRRADPERKEELRTEKAAITAQITELRKRRKMAINIEERSTHIDTMMTHLYENEMEAKTKTQTRTERSYSR